MRITKRMRDLIFMRDQWLCQSCGVKVHNEKLKIIPKNEFGYTYTIYPNEYKEAYFHNTHKGEIDHILSLFNFGNDDSNNLQLLCKYCNSAKSSGEIPKGTNLKLNKLTHKLQWYHREYLLYQDECFKSLAIKKYSYYLDLFIDYMIEMEKLYKREETTRLFF